MDILVLLVEMPRLVSLLGETPFGVFSFACVVIGYLAFLEVGVNRAATKFVSQHLAQEDHDSAVKISVRPPANPNARFAASAVRTKQKRAGRRTVSGLYLIREVS